MNIFRNLFGKVWHDPNAAEVVKISEGQLFLVRKETVRSDRECIYNDAMATVRRVPSVEHHFQLVITRVYEDGAEDLLEEVDETDEERVFLIDEELEFRTGETEGEPTFVWRDLEGDVDETYEFVASGTNAPTRAFFETCMYRAMFERKYKMSADDTTEEQLSQFIWKPPVKKAKGRAGKQTARSAPAAAEEPIPTPSASQTSGADEPPPSQPSQTIDLLHDATFENIVAAQGSLSLFDPELGSYGALGTVIAQIVRPVEGNPFEYWFVATGAGGRVLMHNIGSNMNQRFNAKTASMMWVHSGDKSNSTWCISLDNPDEFEHFKACMGQATWENLNEMSWAKSKAEDQAYVMNSAVEDVEMRDAEDDSDEEDEVADELDKEDDESEPEEDDYDQDPEDSPPALAKGEKNSQLTVGYKGDRSYVVRGNNIGVFSHTGDQVKYYSTISKIQGPKGKQINPAEVMLHDQDTKMVIMDKNNHNSLFHLDLERGKIVEEWKVHDDIPVRHIAPDNKFAQMTTEQTLVGASGNALFRIDPRISGDKLVDSQYKQYVSKNKFSGVATTAQGKLAVASEKGDIRLFDAIGKNAKTALPPLGDPIIGIDVTADGRWIVATTKTYLLLIDTLIGEGRYTGSLGFDRSFPATAKPIPRRLQLRAEHVAYMSKPVEFSPARFNTGRDQEANAIVTSTGEFVVAWDFAKVRKGQLDKYEIKKYEDTVVQDNFKFGDDKEIIVAMENNVVAVNKKQLKRPTRASLATPMRNLQSRSNIVNSPY